MQPVTRHDTAVGRGANRMDTSKTVFPGANTRTDHSPSDGIENSSGTILQNSQRVPGVRAGNSHTKSEFPDSQNVNGRVLKRPKCGRATGVPIDPFATQAGRDALGVPQKLQPEHFQRHRDVYNFESWYFDDVKGQFSQEEETKIRGALYRAELESSSACLRTCGRFDWASKAYLGASVVGVTAFGAWSLVAIPVGIVVAAAAVALRDQLPSEQLDSERDLTVEGQREGLAEVRRACADLPLTDDDVKELFYLGMTRTRVIASARANYGLDRADLMVAALESLAAKPVNFRSTAFGFKLKAITGSASPF